MTNPVYTVAIPTMNRPMELGRCLDAVLAQSPLPESVLVIDDGDLDAAPIMARMESLGIRWDYVRKSAPGLIGSLNLIATRDVAPWVLILDDDIVLESGFVREIFAAVTDEAIGGVAGYPVQPELENLGTRMKWRRALERFFLLGGGVEGRFLSSSFCTDYQLGGHPAAAYAVQHVPGGLGLWRSEVLREFRFDEWFAGYAYANDKEFALRVGARWRLVCAPSARGRHLKSPRSRMPGRRLGAMKIRNQHRLYTLHRASARFRFMAYCWSLLGLIGVTTLSVLTSPSRARAEELFGMVGGLCDVVFGRAA